MHRVDRHCNKNHRLLNCRLRARFPRRMRWEIASRSRYQSRKHARTPRGQKVSHRGERATVSNTETELKPQLSCQSSSRGALRVGRGLVERRSRRDNRLASEGAAQCTDRQVTGLRGSEDWRTVRTARARAADLSSPPGQGRKQQDGGRRARQWPSRRVRIPPLLLGRTRQGHAGR